MLNLLPLIEKIEEKSGPLVFRRRLSWRGRGGERFLFTLKQDSYEDTEEWWIRKIAVEGTELIWMPLSSFGEQMKLL